MQILSSLVLFLPLYISEEDGQDPTESKDVKTKLVESGKKTMDNISGFFNKKKATPAPASNDDVFENIKKLSELKYMGVITQEEFDIKKAELLAKL